MTIVVGTTNVQVGKPTKIILLDQSGAHVILTFAVEGRAPITHAFDFDQGSLEVPIDLKPGSYRCALVVQAFKHGALNGAYASALTINDQLAASAKGKIPSGEKFDVGSGRFTLVVA